jgi:pyruvate/2-oxoglutarate dehydrogenase complex dihydrolipoamide acyltransferase (E2) component
MVREIIFPKISTKTDKGIITAWHREIGEQVKAGELLYEVETEKAVHEVESPITGVVSQILVTVGDEVAVDDVLAEIDENEVK